MKEKAEFEEKEKAEGIEPMVKEERLERVSRRKVTSQTNKLCKEILIEIVNSMETAVTVRRKEVWNIIVKEVEEHGQVFRNKVEKALRSRIREEEAVMEALVADGERADIRGETAKESCLDKEVLAVGDRKDSGPHFENLSLGSNNLNAVS